MSVTTSTYTANSTRITVSNETTSSNIINAFDQAMSKGGWTVYDTVAQTTYSPIVTKVYRVLNADATTYKYLIVRIDTIKLTINTSTCESWDAATTHLPTNETWQGAGAFQQGYDIKDSIILVSATARHCIIWTFIKSEPGMWTGVLEFERVAGEDSYAIASPVPCWAWTSSLMLGTPWGQATNATTSTMMMAFPRTADGLTGANAARTYAPTTNRGMFPPSYPSGTIAITVDPNKLHLGSYYNMTYGWDSLKTVVSPIGADAQSKSMPFGRAYNIGVTKPLGGALDTTTITLDNTGGWPSATGSASECLLLPLNGGADADSTYASTSSVAIYTNNASSAVTLGKPIAIGSTMWIAASNGIYTWDVNAGQGASYTLRYTSASPIYDLVFDGQTTVYGSTSTGIVKIDTETFAFTNFPTPLSTGTSFLALDQKNIYASSRTALTSPQCYIIDRATFALSQIYTVTSATTVATGFGTPTPDYQGNVYIATQAGSIVAQTLLISRFSAATGAETAKQYNPRTLPGATAGGESPTNFWIDQSTGRIYLIAGFVTNGSMYELTTVQSNWTAGTAVIVGPNTFTSGATGAALYSNMNYTTAGGATYDYRADLNVIPVRGVFVVSPKKQGIVTPTGYAARVQLNMPTATTPGQPAGIATSLVNATTYPLGFSGAITTNGVRIFHTYSQVFASDNRTYYISGLHNVAYTVNGFPNGRLVVKG